MSVDSEAKILLADIERALAIGTKFATLDGKPLTTANAIIEALLRDGTINLQEPPLRAMSPELEQQFGYRVKAKLVKLSICDCGYNMLNDEIPLGKMYTAFPQTRRWDFTFGCGNCGKTRTVEALLVDQRSGLPGWLPCELFELDEAITTEILF
jgi:hypothetical protein